MGNAINSELLSEINKMDKELTKIFNVLMGSEFKNLTIKQRSVYRIELIELSNKLLSKMNESIQVLQSSIIEEKKFYRKSLYFCLFGTICAFILIFFNPLIALFVNFGCMMYSKNMKNKLDTSIQEEMDEVTEIVNRVNQLNILYSNCSRRLNLDVDVINFESYEANMKDLEDANDVIVNYMDTRSISSISENVKKYIILLLKDDLKIDSDNYLELLERAYEKNKSLGIKKLEKTK